ncbi:MAG: TetR family transcriptional regulator [Candidatus Pristimantibacillus lignocellulolyticus]|uniref:TetR family transcriptional regulator n=1 Tax=Candidatus Pristimantibacillus lignocellulolyticus TaxID=2994561 RepID=A0A9J6ZIW0_9BACL|nr:MAG: TetR family transcriptional regulator [Candidatus Pristimantibacillus lignocellulolyticus]
MANNKREDILSAALNLFASRGYDGTTVPMIAEQANVGAGTIYRYFESKEQLVNDLFQQWVGNLASSIVMGEEENRLPLREQFSWIFKRLISFSSDHLDAVLFIDSHCGALYLDEKSSHEFNTMLNVFREVLEYGKKEGIIRDFNVNALIGMVWGAFVQLFKLIRVGILQNNDELFTHAEESCWDAIKNSN